MQVFVSFFSCLKEEKRAACIRDCIETVTRNYCSCLPLVSVKNNSQGTEEDTELPFCTPDHLYNCPGNSVEDIRKCYSEDECPMECSHTVFQMTGRTSEGLHNSALNLKLSPVYSQQYPVFTELYQQTWQSFLGELGKLNNLLKYTEHEYLYIYLSLPYDLE